MPQALWRLSTSARQMDAERRPNPPDRSLPLDSWNSSTTTLGTYRSARSPSERPAACSKRQPARCSPASIAPQSGQTRCAQHAISPPSPRSISSGFIGASSRANSWSLRPSSGFAAPSSASSSHARTTSQDVTPTRSSRVSLLGFSCSLPDPDAPAHRDRGSPPSRFVSKDAAPSPRSRSTCVAETDRRTRPTPWPA